MENIKNKYEGVKIKKFLILILMMYENYFIIDSVFFVFWIFYIKDEII